ncbi:MAG: NAD(P)H-dependent oxidoreductase subunit E [Bacteroidales bacterium]
MDVLKVIKKVEPKKENLLNILHVLQDSHPQNYLPDDTLAHVARYLNLPLSSVSGVVGYYSMFSRKPRGRFIVRICNSPVCNLNSSEDIITLVQEILGVKPGQTTPDNLFTVEESECLGRCGKAPSMMVNQIFYGKLNRERLEKIFSDIKNGIQ